MPDDNDSLPPAISLQGVLLSSVPAWTEEVLPDTVNPTGDTNIILLKPIVPASLIPPTSPPPTLSSLVLLPSPQPPIPPPEPTSAPCQLCQSEYITHLS